jgi:zinc protease
LASNSKLFLSLVFIFASLSGCAYSPSGKEAISRPALGLVSSNRLPNGLEAEEYRLPNGLRLFLVINPSAPVFNYQLWVHAGSLTEVMDPKLKRAGLAHLFEHMMFRGTKKNPGRDYDLKMSAAGQTGLNATTSYDRTNYFVSLPKDKLDFLLEIESDRFQNLIIDEALFKNELGAVLGELKMGNDRPGTVAYYDLMSLIFPTHPYGVNIIGFEADLKKMTVEEANYFYRTYYSPNNYTLVLVGDLDRAETLRLVGKYFGDMPAREIPHSDAQPEPLQTSPRRKNITHPAAENVSFYLGYRTTQDSSPDSAALEILGSILGNGDGSILQKALVDGGLASSIGVGQNGMRQAGVFLFVAQVRDGVKTAKIESRIEASLERIRQGKISEKELSRARNLLLLQKYNGLDDNSGIGELIAEGLLLNGDHMSLFRRIEELKKVDVKQVTAVAKKYMTKNLSSILVMSPEKKNAKN